ncbi:hypothetical protein NW762_004614 [Fusarium torreyae]|uniref:B30.2/SPRY domain-containing protein n=1 Tax=Fusarium torreyae TaxID=1237075 RepID=A0A9W8S4J3_9HYPO|nr:hypothetical protein NW762_004614 [Fusarium torreyae]
MSWHIKLLFLMLLARKVAAADDAEFAFNLFSDIAPILALFGDRFARQFMSESLEWTDHILFAMVPLGIITTITSAIRVAGSSRLKAFIGYAKENKALAEIELMSSTSEEVCELFNGKSVVRAMGKPAIATFLIFPDRLPKSWSKKKNGNGQDSQSNSNVVGVNDANSTPSTSYIHSPKTIGTERTKLTKPEVGSGKGDDGSKNQGSNFQRFLRLLPLHPNQKGNNGRDTEKGQLINETPTAGNSTTKSDNNSATPGNKKSSSNETARDFPGPPNLQLNISSGSREDSNLQKIQSLMLTAIGFILQLGLIAIAGAVELRVSDQGSELFESKAYGFPCYTAGSILLCVGTWLCSVIIEQSTSESLWRVCGDDKPTESAPQLVWLQQAHRVNDQFFKGYVIFAGRKNDLVTSERTEDYDRRLENKKLEAQLIPPPPKPSPNRSSTQHTTSGMSSSTRRSGSPVEMSPGIEKTTSDNQTAEQAPGNFRSWYNKLIGKFNIWELLTSMASLLAALGFILQFMGLRGLAFPCSIAQLLAILVMAGIRAFVRRKLGREIHHYEAPAGYELDFLATYLLVKSSEMSDYMDCKEMPQPPLPPPEALLQWRVKTPEYVRTSASQDPSLSQQVEEAPFPSSSRLVEVRQRLGDLCQWKGKALGSALALSQSIEAFMNEFFDTAEYTGTPLDWQIRAANWDNKLDTFPIQITKNEEVQSEKSSKWRVDVGTVDSTLSLWMAGIVARKIRNQDRPYDWRRAKDGDDLKYPFVRIIGNNDDDGVLKRDIAWWVGETIANESDKSGGCDPDVQDDTCHEIVIGPIEEDMEVPNENCNETRTSPKGKLSITRVESLPVILAQHLFTRFVWFVVKHQRLSKSLRPHFKNKGVSIKGMKTFEGFNFTETWYQPHLIHQKLSELVSRMSSLGLGSEIDIFLCIVPALSSQDLLPNSVILTLMPPILPNRELLDIARCYAGLLKNFIRKEKPEKLRDTVIIRTMDFLYYAYERYHEVEPLPPDTQYELEQIASMLVRTLSTDNTNIFIKLARVYESQCRRVIFRSIFLLLNVVEEDINKLGFSETADLNFDEHFAQQTLEFSRDHISLCKDDKPVKRGTSKLHETRDIFNWTLLHYACAGGQDRALDYVENAVRGHVPQLGDYFQRNPFHIAAINNNKPIPRRLLESFAADDESKLIILETDCNGLTPLHLAARDGNGNFLSTIIKCYAKHKSVLKDALAKKDYWGRQPLHVATKFRQDECARELIKAGSLFGVPDREGNCPIDYFVDSRRTEFSRKNNIDLFLQFKPQTTDLRFNNRRTFLHIAAEVLDESRFKELIEDFDTNAKDSDGRTALHLALVAGRGDIAKVLINKCHDVNVKSNDGQTPLLLALSAGLTDVANTLINGSEKKANIAVRDNQGRTALMYAARGISSEPSKVTGTASSEASELDDKGPWDSKADETLFNSLMNGETGIKAVDDNVETALHHAIEASNEPAMRYLLSFSRTQERMFDETESPLVKACVCGFLIAVQEILKIYPSMINQGDRSYNQPPISWACENGHHDIVEILIKNKSIDVNRPATGDMERTPLHFAVQAQDDECLAILLQCENLDISVRDSLNRTPLDIAIRRSRFEKIDKILGLIDHNRMSDQERLRSLRLIDDSLPPQPKDLIRGILGSIKDEFLLNEYLFRLIEGQGSTMPDEIKDFMKVSLAEREVQKLKAPYHRAVLLGEAGVIEHLPKLSEDQTDLDKDNWRSLDYAEKLGLTNQLKWDEGKTPKTTDQYLMPTTLLWDDLKDNIKVTQCSSSGQAGCNKVLDVKVVKAHSQIEIVCIRADHPIPPRGAAKTFYFEIEVLETASSEWLAIGFCGSDMKPDQMPGWFERSWAFHGDDGGLYMNSGEEMIEPSGDFGKKAVFKKGDFVGVQLDTGTGMGICTRNGEMLNMGNAFQDSKDKYKLGKMYPCVGFRLDEEENKLHFKVNFGISIGSLP